MNNKFDIEKFLSLEGYATNDRVSRRKLNKDLDISNTCEFFTPYKLIRKLADKISEKAWSNPDKNFLEPCMGNGQMILYIIYNRIIHGISWDITLSHLWGIDILEDNVRETHQRVHNLFEQMGIEYDKEMAQQIMNHNLVCHNFFDWDFQNWCPIKEEKSMPLF